MKAVLLETPRTYAWLDDDPRPLDWNGPVDRPFSPVHEQDLERPIVEHLERMALSHRGRIAIRDAATVLTFGELWDGVSGLAETLEFETRPGDLIGLLMPACPMFPVAMLACLAAGRPFVVLDPHHPPDWLDHVVRDARPALIVALEDEPRVPATRMLRLKGTPTPARHGWRPAGMQVDEPACILFTSGSTGRPKGIVNSQRNLLQRVAQSINAGHINTEDRLLTLASPSTIVGVRDVLTALLAGASIRLVDPHSAGVREILNVLREDAATILFAFPALLRSIVAFRDMGAAASLRLLRVGGDTTLWSDVEAMRRWLAPGAAVQVVYAATEAPMMQWFVDDRCRRDDVRIPIGYPLPGNRLSIVDEDGDTVLPGDVGELVVSSPYVALGCAADEHAGGSRVFRTGDLVRQRSDGLLERVGRKDRQVKIRGSRVDLDGVEAMLRGHPLVRDAAAVARASGGDGATTLVAYVSAHDRAPAWLIDELKLSMRSAPSPMRPGRFYLVPTIPRLPSSKLDVRALTALDEARLLSEFGDSTAETGRARSDGDRIARTVARVWQQVLQVPLRRVDDDFFDSGGDSLAALTFTMELERALGLEISLTLVNEAPRFDQLCQALRERRAPGSTPLVSLKTGDSSPPLFFIHGIGGNVVKFLPVARRLGYPGEVIGVRARGVVPGETPHATVEAMATDYLKAIKDRQPGGPYYLCGYSSGGVVAFEIARRLSESGDEIGFVGLLDAVRSPARWPLRVWLSILSRRVRLLGATRVGPIAGWPVRLRRTTERLRSIAPSLRVAAHTLVASARYRPGFYEGHLTLFSPSEREPGLPSLQSIWRTHARTIAVAETPGTHSNMLSTINADETAACLTRAIMATSRRSTVRSMRPSATLARSLRA